MKNYAIAAATLTGAGLVAAITLGVGQPGAAASARGSHTETYQIPFSTSKHAFVGADEKHPALGDRSIDVGRVTLQGHAVGSAVDTCTVVRSHGRDVQAQCVSTFELAHGEVDALTSPANGHGPTTTLALVGGTGRYAGASGTVTAVSGKSSAQLVLRY